MDWGGARLPEPRAGPRAPLPGTAAPTPPPAQVRAVPRRARKGGDSPRAKPQGGKSPHLQPRGCPGPEAGEGRRDCQKRVRRRWLREGRLAASAGSWERLGVAPWAMRRTGASPGRGRLSRRNSESGPVFPASAQGLASLLRSAQPRRGLRRPSPLSSQNMGSPCRHYLPTELPRSPRSQPCGILANNPYPANPPPKLLWGAKLKSTAPQA